MELDALIEAILFFKAEPMMLRELARDTERTEEEISGALDVLEARLSDRGIHVIRKDDEVMLGTAPEAGKIIEEMIREDLSKDLGKAGLETLSIVLYRGPISRAEIDYIRGVNSNFILRNLLVRGLVEKIPNPDDSRSFLYRPSFQLLTYLGVTRVEDLPEYEEVRHQVDEFYKEQSHGVEQKQTEEEDAEPAQPEEEPRAPQEESAFVEEEHVQGVDNNSLEEEEEHGTNY